MQWQRALIATCYVLMQSACTQTHYSVAPTFVHLRTIDPTIQQQMAYASTNNFVGRVIPGYQHAECLLTPAAAQALQSAQHDLASTNYGLLVYDCYRPVRAVEYFYTWSLDPNDEINKADYFPRIDKELLFAQGYIALQSGHSRGSTVDLTLIDKTTGVPLDMGTRFDFFGPEAHLDYSHLTKQQQHNRARLNKLMQTHGFIPYEFEWWHFTLRNEPYPNKAFDIPIA